eukprot:gene14515-biopygen3604
MRMGLYEPMKQLLGATDPRTTPLGGALKAPVPKCSRRVDPAVVPTRVGPRIGEDGRLSGWRPQTGGIRVLLKWELIGLVA